jgi:hypothetical protein
MNLLLVDNLIVPEQGSLATMDVHPHLGLLALATAAQAHGHRASIYDPKRLIRSGRLPYDETLYERVAQDLLACSPEAVGFTTLGCSFLFASNVAALLKRREPDLPILLGGPHATMLHQPILERFPQFDLVARHECDEILPTLLDALPFKRFEHIPGLSWRDGSRLRQTEGRPKVEDLDTLPLLDYDHSQGCSVAGGYVYRGTRMPEIVGRYFYSDYCSGWLRSFRFSGGVVSEQRDWNIPAVAALTSFGEDASGELYMLAQGGTAYRIVRK